MDNNDDDNNTTATKTKTKKKTTTKKTNRPNHKETYAERYKNETQMQKTIRETNKILTLQRLLNSIKNLVLSEQPLVDSLKTRMITNMSSTININVTNLDLRRLSQQSYAVNYDKGTFAAMTIRLSTRCCALLYPRGTMVSMGTRSSAETMLAGLRYVDVLNKELGVKCMLRGIQIVNIVFSLEIFKLDLTHCNKREWSSVMQYDPQVFPGATLRCKFMQPMPFDTDVVFTFFDTGKVNCAGARSIDEFMYLYIIVYFSYLVHMQVSTATRKRNVEQMLRGARRFKTEIDAPVIEENDAARREYNSRQQLRDFVRLKNEDGSNTYHGDFVNTTTGRVTHRKIDVQKDIPPHINPNTNNNNNATTDEEYDEMLLRLLVVNKHF